MSSAFERLLSDVSRETPAIKPESPEPSTLDSISEQFSRKVREQVQVDNTQIPPTGAEVHPEQVSEVDPTDIGDKLAFGFAQATSGTREADVRSDITYAYRYLKADHPELAAKLGIREKGSYSDPTDSYILNSLVAFAQAADTTLISGLATLFGSEKQVENWDNYITEHSFGKEWYDMDAEGRRQYMDDQATTQLQKDFPAFYANPELRESAWVTAGNVGAALVSPTTLLGPAAATYKSAAGIGAGWGAMDMALLDLADRGKIDPMHVAGGALFGTVFAPTLRFSVLKGGKYIGEVFDKVATRHKYNQSNKLLNQYEEMVAKEVSHGVSRGIARNTAQGGLGLDNKTINHMYTVTGRERKLPKNAEQAADFMSTIEERSGWWRQNQAINRAGTEISKWTTPIIDRMTKLSPKLAHAMRGVDFRTHIRTHAYFERSKPWLKKFNKLSKANQLEIKKLLSTDSHASYFKASRIMYEMEKKDPSTFTGFSSDWREIKTLLKEIADEYTAKGYDFKPLDYFFPRTAKYPKHMTNAHAGLFHKLSSDAAEKKGSALTHEELGLLMRNTFRRIEKEGGKVKSSGHLRERSVNEITDFMEPYYADPIESLHSYLRMASNDIERMSFFQKFGLTHKEKVHIDKIDSAIPKDIGKLAKSLNGLDNYQREQVVDMLRVRFTSGEASPHRFWQNFKNLGYILTIFNPYSAMTQFGDQAFPMFKYGINRTVKVWVTPAQIQRSDLGLTDAMEELYANTTMTKKVMDGFAKYSGFQRIDTFGKDTILNAALQKYIKQAKTPKGNKEIAAKWGRFFEDETPKLLKDLRAGELTDNVKLLLWHELADVQPIALSEMPEKYLAMPNGRIFYMLKSFLIKQLSFVRRQIVGELQQNNTTTGIKNLALFAGYWNLVGGTVDVSRSALIDMFAGTNTPIDLSDLMVENTIQMMGLSKYHGIRAGKEGPVNTVMDFFLPPIPFVDDIAIAAYQDRPEKAWRAVPGVGPVMHKILQAKKKQQKRMGSFEVGAGEALSPRESKSRKRLQQFYVE